MLPGVLPQENKPDLGKNIIQVDFFYVYTGEERRTEDQKAPDKVLEKQGSIRNLFDHGLHKEQSCSRRASSE